MLAVFGPEVVEAQQRLAIFDHFGNGLVVFHPVGLDEEIEGGFCVRPSLGLPIVVQMTLGFGLHRFWHGLEDIAGFMHPAALLAGGAKDLAQCGPEPQGAIADGQSRSHAQSPVLEIQQQLAPTLGAFAIAVSKAEHLLLIPFISADQHQHALLFLGHAWLEINPVGSDVDDPPGAEIPPLPALVVIPPLGCQP